MKKPEKKRQNIKNEYVFDDFEVREKHGTTFFKFIKKHSIIFPVLTVALLLVVVYFWKDIESKREKEIILQNATNQLDIKQREMLMLVAKPLVWSIREDMLRGNLEQVNLLITDLVKEKNFQFIHLVAPDGNVILSTNKGFESKPIGDNVDTSLLQVRSHMVVIQLNNVLYVAAPISGIDKQIATLIVGYKPELMLLDKKTN